MTPVFSQVRHDPDGKVWGDCHRAAVATVLDLPLLAVPHFSDGWPSGDEFKRRERKFLASHGLVPIDLVYTPPAECGHELILRVVGDMNPGVPYILGGTSRHRVDHSVVCLDDRIVHDPSRDEDGTAAGIVGPCADGWYWITFFGAKSLGRLRCDLCGSPADIVPPKTCAKCFYD